MKVLSGFVYILTGSGVPGTKFFDCSLNCLQKSMALIPTWPRDGPIGGAGVACPAFTYNLISAEAVCAAPEEPRVRDDMICRVESEKALFYLVGKDGIDRAERQEIKILVFVKESSLMATRRRICLQRETIARLCELGFYYYYSIITKSKIFCATLAQLGERQTEDLKASCSIHEGRIFLFHDKAFKYWTQDHFEY